MKTALALLALALASFSFAQTPESVVQKFVDALNKKDLSAAAKLVKGGSADVYINQMLSGHLPTIQVSDLASATTGDYALVTFKVATTNPPGIPTQTSFLVLTKNGSDWLIDVAERDEGIGLIAYVISNPPLLTQARAAARATACLSNLKQVALAVIMLETDDDDVLKATSPNWVSKIQPYLKSKDALRCPDDTSGGVSYSINPKLLGKSADSIQNPAETVLLYEGSAGKLVFRHTGRACVAFTDGHVKLMNEEQAKTLRWNP